uniref:Tail protein n=1 Tax=viral metagenome TaxID=1070528 RepID=A0A6H1ZWA8_9ZZZZ
MFEGMAVPDLLKDVTDETMKSSLSSVSQFLDELILKGKKSVMVNADGDQTINGVKSFTGDNIFSGKNKIAAQYGDWTTDTDGATVTFNMAASCRHKVTLGGNRTLAVSSVSTGQVFIIKLIQDGTGSRTVTWFVGISWPSAVVPTLTTTLNKSDFFIFICTGTDTYDGFIVGQNL